MSGPERYEVLVLGSGAGGKFIAWIWRNPGAGQPSSSAVGSARPARISIACPARTKSGARKSPTCGATLGNSGPCRARWRSIWRKCANAKRDMVEGLIATHLDRYKESGAELSMGTGHFIEAKTLEVHLNGGGTRVLARE